MSRYPESHFKALDASIVAAISGGTSSYSTLCQRFGPEARVLCPDKDASRVVDRRLQTLRKAGHIVYVGSSGWKATASPPKAASLAKAQLYVVDNLRELAAELIVLWDTAKRPAGGHLDALTSLCQADVGVYNAAKVAEHPAERREERMKKTTKTKPPSAPATGSDGVARMLLITQCRECTHCGETMDNHWQVSGAYCRKTGKKMDPFGPIPEFCPLPTNT